MHTIKIIIYFISSVFLYSNISAMSLSSQKENPHFNFLFFSIPPLINFFNPYNLPPAPPDEDEVTDELERTAHAVANFVLEEENDDEENSDDEEQEEILTLEQIQQIHQEHIARLTNPLTIRQLTPLALVTLIHVFNENRAPYTVDFLDTLQERILDDGFLEELTIEEIFILLTTLRTPALTTDGTLDTIDIDPQFLINYATRLNTYDTLNNLSLYQIFTIFIVFDEANLDEIEDALLHNFIHNLAHSLSVALQSEPNVEDFILSLNPVDLFRVIMTLAAEGERLDQYTLHFLSHTILSLPEIELNHAIYAGVLNDIVFALSTLYNLSIRKIHRPHHPKKLELYPPFRRD